MNNQARTPVTIVQQLIAVHTTRKEVIERLQPKIAEEMKSKLAAAGRQSNRAIAALMNELSNYGDAVQSQVDKSDDYNTTWNSAVAGINSLSPEAAAGLFESLEESLKTIYADLQKEDEKLPETFTELLNGLIKED